MISKYIKFFKFVLFSLISTICFFAFLELSIFIGLHAVLGFSKADIFHVKIGRFAGPSLNQTPEEERIMPKNSLGFLGPNFSHHKPSGTFRVLAIGGSALSGELSKALRMELAKNCPKKACEVIDGGVPGSRDGRRNRAHSAASASGRRPLRWSPRRARA